MCIYRVLSIAILLLFSVEASYETDKSQVSEIFDTEHYSATYRKQLEGSALSPLDHFMQLGWKDKLNPNNWFNIELYQELFPCEENPVLDWLNQASGITAEIYPEELIFCETSHPPRIDTTFLSLESFLRQKKKANRVILALARSDFPNEIIPQSLEILKRRGLEILFSDINYKVATKLLPVLKEHTDAVIITGDDDRLYLDNWSEVLLNEHKKHPGKIISASTRSYVFDSAGQYSRIDYLAQDIRYGESGYSIFEGFASVLYPPHAFNEEVFNFDNFQMLTPCADDVWFQTMAILNGTETISLSKEMRERFNSPREINGTQEAGLFHEHLHANDWMAYRALSYYNLLQYVDIPKYDILSCKTCKRKVWIPKPGDDLRRDHTTHMTTTTPATTTPKGKKCQSCFNPHPKKILSIGAYGLGNIGDNIYKETLDYHLSPYYDMFFIPDTVRIDGKGNYILSSSTKEDLDFDALIIGGGGILRDFEPSSSISYYMKHAIQNQKPFFVVSTGIQTSKPNLTPEQATEHFGETAELLKQASLITVRSNEDYFLMRSVLGERFRHKLHMRPDLGYLYADLVRDSFSEQKKYITLVQTGSANVKMGYVQDMIRKKLAEHPGSELVIMNMGGVENPSKAKDFKEWDLFDIDTRRIFPEAKIYMGDSLSPEIKALTRSSVPLRESDLTPRQAAEIIARSHYMLSGRYHGKIFAKAFGTPYDEAICTFKCIAEEESCLDPKRPFDSIQYIKDFLESNRTVEGIPTEWSNDQRNSAIVTVNQLYPNMDIPFVQGMDNGTLYRLLARPHH